MALYSFNQLKNDMGVIRTTSLFYELSYENQEHVLFTTKEEDTETLSGRKIVSLSQIFIDKATTDPTEYNFAKEVFGSWEVWQKICNANAIKKHVDKWRKECAVRRKAMAFSAIVSEAVSDGRGRVGAAKYLIEEPWRNQGPSKDGRAARKEVRESAADAFERAAVSEDLKRLREEGLVN